MKTNEVDQVKCCDCGYNYNQTQCINCSNYYASRFIPKTPAKERVSFRYRIEKVEVAGPEPERHYEKRIVLAEYTEENKDKHQWFNADEVYKRNEQGIVEIEVDRGR